MQDELDHVAELEEEYNRRVKALVQVRFFRYQPTMLSFIILESRGAEPCHFSAAPAPEPSIFFTAPAPALAPAPTYIASHQFLKINAYGTLFFH